MARRLVRILRHLLPAETAAATAGTGWAPPVKSVEDLEFEDYIRRGEERALILPNRGPLRFEKDGKLAPEIVKAYQDYGFYVFKGAVSPEELADLRREYEELMDKAPTLHPDPKKDIRTGFDRHGEKDIETKMIEEGRIGFKFYNFSKPLSDPFGGTGATNGRYPAKMRELATDSSASGVPERTIMLLGAPLAYMDSALRLYGHPGLLRATATINGEDFTAFREALWVKQPGLGPAVAWHQDGTSHKMDGPNNHGFNFMAQLYSTDGSNGLWVVPGSHQPIPSEQWTTPDGRADIKELSRSVGSDRLESAVPLMTDPGDVVICNRQCVHGSFPNASTKLRVSLVFGFHPRSQVLNVLGESRNVVYDEARIARRGRMIALGIAARKERFPEEEPYSYLPTQGVSIDMRNNAQVGEIRNKYNVDDLGI